MRALAGRLGGKLPRPPEEAVLFLLVLVLVGRDVAESAKLAAANAELQTQNEQVESKVASLQGKKANVECMTQQILSDTENARRAIVRQFDGLDLPENLRIDRQADGDLAVDRFVARLADFLEQPSEAQAGVQRKVASVIRRLPTGVELWQGDEE